MKTSILFCLLLISGAKANLDMTIEQVMTQFAPRVYFHPEELYFPDSAEYVFASSEQFRCRVENELIFSKRRITCHPGYYVTSSNLTSSKDMKSWIEIPEHFYPGNLSRAETYVHRRLVDEKHTDFFISVFSPYNGPVNLRATCGAITLIQEKRLDLSGRHQGDWEHFTLRMNHEMKKPVAIFLSRHGGGYWYPYDELDDDEQDYGRKVIYSAKFAHAFYPTIGRFSWCSPVKFSLGVCTVDAELIDETGRGDVSFATWKRFKEINPYDEQSAVGRYQGRWGKYDLFEEKVHVFFTDRRAAVGPHGPIMKTAWLMAEENYKPSCK